jgi:hypothetical protein
MEDPRIPAAGRVAHTFFPSVGPDAKIKPRIDEDWERAVLTSQLNSGYPHFLANSYPTLTWVRLDPRDLVEVTTKLDLASVLFSHLEPSGGAVSLPTSAEQAAMRPYLTPANLGKKSPSKGLSGKATGGGK